MLRLSIYPPQDKLRHFVSFWRGIPLSVIGQSLIGFDCVYAAGILFSRCARQYTANLTPSAEAVIQIVSSIIPKNFRQLLSRSLLVANAVLAGAAVAIAEPRICVGFNPATEDWGSQIRNTELLCPDHYALMGTSKPMRELDARAITLAGACCPLPALDILTSKHEFVESRCDDRSVATGVRRVVSSAGAKEIQLRCTQVNLERYQLAAEVGGALWGFDLSSGPYFWKERRVLRSSDLPAALRYGLARHDYQEFSLNGCVGVPFGSLVVGRVGKRCKDILFRELQYRGESGSPAGVAMFPSCRYLSDPFSVTPKCIE